MFQSLESAVALSMAALALSVGSAAWVLVGDAAPVSAASQTSLPILGSTAFAAGYVRASSREFRPMEEPPALSFAAAR